MSRNDAQVEVEVEVLRHTAAAIEVEHERGTCWVPKSQVSDWTGRTVDVATTIFVPEWLATAKGMA